MSIRAGIVVAVALQKINDAPRAEARTQRNNKNLKRIDCVWKKAH